MQDFTLAFVILVFTIGLHVGTWLPLGKEWLRHRYPYLWPQSDRNDAYTPVDSESTWGGRGEATVTLTYTELARLVEARATLLHREWQVRELAGAIPVERDETLDPVLPSNH
ncbi:hypothetical protein PITC_038590 [Penicillium italicum]|uniref:Uncharacterized protein n=1 Tax=Penicillium italicum TaxID=40296 RepID=A0A0A2KGR2_PENIT|nr:hypothetical protein PITC_038590 [Penicillium italicum]